MILSFEEGQSKDSCKIYMPEREEDGVIINNKEDVMSTISFLLDEYGELRPQHDAGEGHPLNLRVTTQDAVDHHTHPPIPVKDVLLNAAWKTQRRHTSMEFLIMTWSPPYARILDMLKIPMYRAEFHSYISHSKTQNEPNWQSNVYHRYVDEGEYKWRDETTKSFFEKRFTTALLKTAEYLASIAHSHNLHIQPHPADALRDNETDNALGIVLDLKAGKLPAGVS